MNLTRIPWRYTGRAYELPTSSYRQTDRQTIDRHGLGKYFSYFHTGVYYWNKLLEQ